MKKIFRLLAIFCLAMLQTAFAQNINLKFTGSTTDGKYVQLDSVKVENISRNWTETLVYPDTVLTLTDETGIDEMESNSLKCLLYPNPCNGKTNVFLTLAQDETVTMQVYNLAGQCIMEKQVQAEAGENHFEINLDHPQAYFLVAQTAHGRWVQKLINTSHSGDNGIAYIGNQGANVAKTQKLLSSKPFQKGDVLKMTAYATLYNTLVVSETIQQSQTESEILTMVFALPVFSLANGTLLVFSPGNLQWSATNGGSTPTTHVVAGNGTAAGTWRFAPNQWDTIGAGNSNIDSSYTGWIDLFGWGTSGYDNKYPYMTSTTDFDYYNGKDYLYATNYDWGFYNAIYNPKTKTTDVPGTWRTIGRYDLEWLLERRVTASRIRYAMANVHGINGLIIVPDNWSESVYALNNVNAWNAGGPDYSDNTITDTDWTKMEIVGCVFLPAAGNRHGTSVKDVGDRGNYWASESGGTSSAFYLDISSYWPPIESHINSKYGFSVRLVKEVQ